MKRGFVTVLDYSVDEVHIYKFFLHNIEEIEQYIETKGHKIKNCFWMISDDLNLTIHKHDK